MSSNVHQLPPPPPAHQQAYPQAQRSQQDQYYPQQRPEQNRPRATSGFSFHSRKSSGSAGGGKLAPETHAEKESQRLHTKADPSMALNEAEPSAIAVEQSSLASMRGLSFKDVDGNMISEPDRSNPTRSRWERPLDTIRSFEAAIDGNYRRQSYMRSEASDVGTTRRSSYYGGTQVTMDDRSRQHSGYYGQGRMSRPESYMDRQNGMGRGDSYYDPNSNGPSNGYVPNRARYPRTASEPQFNPGQGVYPANGAQHSYETVTTASGSGSSADHNGYSTDPSSENSSVDRITPLRENNENYGFNGYGNTHSNLNPGYNQYKMGGANGVPRSQGPPPPPPHNQYNAAPPRVPMKLGKTNSNTAQEKAAPAEKRKSWFGKRFSKN